MIKPFLFFFFFCFFSFFFFFWKGFALISNQMLEQIWFKVLMISRISRIDNLSFLAAVRNISQSASCVCKLLPAGDISQFAMGGTGLWQASSQYGNAVMWQQGYQIVAGCLHSAEDMSHCEDREQATRKNKAFWEKWREGHQGRGCGWDEKGSQEAGGGFGWRDRQELIMRDSLRGSKKGELSICSEDGWVLAEEQLPAKDQTLCSPLGTWKGFPGVHRLFYLLVE